MRDKFLDRIKKSLDQTLVPDAGSRHPGSFPNHRSSNTESGPELAAAFTRELQALAGYAHPVDRIESAAGIVLDILRNHHARTVMAWTEPKSSALATVHATIIDAGISAVPYVLPGPVTERRAQLAELDGIIVGITGAQGGLADSGAIALVSGDGRGRLPSLLPPVHVAILSRQRIFPSLPAFLAAHPEVTTEGSNLVFVAGPSRTGDIEMTLTMGVHGPGEVHVILTP